MATVIEISDPFEEKSITDDLIDEFTQNYKLDLFRIVMMQDNVVCTIFDQLLDESSYEAFARYSNLELPPELIGAAIERFRTQFKTNLEVKYQKRGYTAIKGIWNDLITRVGYDETEEGEVIFRKFKILRASFDEKIFSFTTLYLSEYTNRKAEILDSILIARAKA